MSAAEALASPSKSVEAGGDGGSDAELPKALLKRIIKAGLAQWDTAAGGDGMRDFQVSKDALLACSEAGKLFISYLAASANDVCRDARRQTISADDVLTALEDLDFGELVEPLKAALEAYKAENREKLKKRSEAGKKRKASGAADEEPPAASKPAGAAVGAAARQAAEGEQRQQQHQEQPPQGAVALAGGEAS